MTRLMRLMILQSTPTPVDDGPADRDLPPPSILDDLALGEADQKDPGMDAFADVFAKFQPAPEEQAVRLHSLLAYLWRLSFQRCSLCFLFGAQEDGVVKSEDLGKGEVIYSDDDMPSECVQSLGPPLPAL